MVCASYYFACRAAVLLIRIAWVVWWLLVGWIKFDLWWFCVMIAFAFYLFICLFGLWWYLVGCIVYFKLWLLDGLWLVTLIVLLVCFGVL